MPQDSKNPEPEDRRIPGLCARDRLFTAIIPVSTLVQDLTIHPQELEDGTDNLELQKLRNQIQRSLTGAKGRNVGRFQEYLAANVLTGSGFAPPIILWNPEGSQIVEDVP